MDQEYRLEVARRLERAQTQDPQAIFGGLDEELWLWVNTVGNREIPELRAILPGLPSTDVQHQFTGKAGDDTLREGHALSVAFKEQYEKHGGPILPSTAVLDFGCGWGRIIRFLLKDVSPDNLWGIDCNEALLTFCRESNPWCRFEVNEPLPPTTLHGGSFDLIYSYSVFTHLSEPVHMQWLAELRRLLKPEGILIVTVRPRGFISYCGSLTEDSALSHGSQASLVGMFPDTEAALGDYDGGRYCYAPYDRSSYGDWWGEACVSPSYIDKAWAGLFDVVDFIEDPARFKQHIVVLRNATT